MKPLDPPYVYQLDNLHPTKRGRENCTLFFVQKEANEDGVYVTKHDGTTNEEVLMALIHRLTTLNDKMPGKENEMAIDKLQEALMWLNLRTTRRQERGVEGTTAP
jgi:hypothetical protein